MLSNLVLTNTKLGDIIYLREVLAVSKNVTITIDEDTYEKFCMALALNKEDQSQAFEHCMKWYIAESFDRVSQKYNPNTKLKSLKEIAEGFNGKANQRIPTWAIRPTQYNHKIIRAFFEIEQEQGDVTLSALEKLCSNKYNQKLYVPTFKSNYAQMKLDAPKSHGKVFKDDGNIVTIWSEVEHTLLSYREFFLGNQKGVISPMRITNEMSEQAYEIAKKVYYEQLTRTEARLEIADITGMSEGSAGDYITNLLAMLDGKKYTRTLNTYATRYFLVSIKRDFGEDLFEKAKQAVAQHIKYYNALGNGNLNSIQEVINELG